MHRLSTLYQNLKSDRRLGHPGFTASDNNKKVLRAVSGHFDLDIKIFLKCGWNHQRIIHIKQRIQYGPIQIRREVIGNIDSQFQSFSDIKIVKASQSQNTLNSALGLHGSTNNGDDGLLNTGFVCLY